MDKYIFQLKSKVYKFSLCHILHHIHHQLNQTYLREVHPTFLEHYLCMEINVKLSFVIYKGVITYIIFVIITYKIKTQSFFHIRLNIQYMTLIDLFFNIFFLLQDEVEYIFHTFGFWFYF